METTNTAVEPVPRRRRSRDELIASLAATCTAVRKSLLRTIVAGGSGHCGGSLSTVELLVALYFRELSCDPGDPSWAERDRFVLSKGHAAPALYAVLAERGYFPAEELQGFRKIGRMLQGHPSPETPGVECASGSLGQGFSAALGMAVGLWLTGRRGPKVFCLVGDGELQEGQCWEVAMAAGHRRQANLAALVDANGLQQDGPVCDTLEVEPLADKWRAFGWAVREIDGHDLGSVLEALAWSRTVQDAPQVVIARTAKGRGVSFMEDAARWHGTAPPTAEELARALAELDAAEARA